MYMLAKIKGKEQEYIFGTHSIIEVFKARKRAIISLYTTKPVPKAWPLIARYLSRTLSIHYVTRDVLTRMAGTSDHQSVVAVTTPFPIRKKPFNPEQHPFLLLIENIQDGRNLGAILRSAYCTGISGVIISRKKSAPIDSFMLKASAGLAEHLEIYETSSTSQTAQELKREGYSLYMAVLGGKDALTITYKKPLCLVIGNEATGISKELLAWGNPITIPQKTTDISYNASVAAGILLFLIASSTKQI
jgi:23S rRNA (guanosine2251-2'-O)-methyltransferase